MEGLVKTSAKSCQRAVDICRGRYPGQMVVPLLAIPSTGSGRRRSRGGLRHEVSRQRFSNESSTLTPPCSGWLGVVAKIMVAVEVSLRYVPGNGFWAQALAVSHWQKLRSKPAFSCRILSQSLSCCCYEVLAHTPRPSCLGHVACL